MSVVPLSRNRPEVILTRQELAEELKVSTRTIDRWVKEGLPSEQLARERIKRAFGANVQPLRRTDATSG